MIEVLRDWGDVGHATRALRRARLPGHGLPEKNWDLHCLQRMVETLPREAHVVDLGCGGLHALRFLAALGFTNLTGLDLTITPYERAVQARRFLKARRVPFRLRRSCMTKTGLPDATADAVVALSAIEHGVNPDAFFAEAARIMKPGARLFVTTDYWPDGAAAAPDLFGLPWTVFDRPAIGALLDAAGRHGLRLMRDGPVPDVGDRVVAWEGREYTFIKIVFERVP